MTPRIPINDPDGRADEAIPQADGATIPFEEDDPRAPLTIVEAAQSVADVTNELYVILKAYSIDVVETMGPIEGKSPNSPRGDESVMAFMLGQLRSITVLVEDLRDMAQDIVERP